MLLRRVSALTVSAMAAISLAGCGNTDTPTPSTPKAPAPSAVAPSVGEMLASAVEAAPASSNHVRVKIKFDGTSTDAQLKPLLAKGLDVELEGYASKSLIDLTGTAKLLGQSYGFAYKGDETKSFAQFNDQWYGPGPGLTATAKAAAQRAPQQENVKPDDFTSAKLAAGLRAYAGKVLTGAVVAGPETDGAPTWQYKGSPSAKGIEEAVRAADPTTTPTTAEDRAILGLIEKALVIEVVTGQDDKRVKLARVTGSLSSDDLKSFPELKAKTDGKDFSIKLVAEVAITKAGSAPTISAPAGVQPWEGLGQAAGAALLGAVMSSGVPLNPSSSSSSQQIPAVPQDDSAVVGPDATTIPPARMETVAPASVTR
jgi:hypothetical protein